MGLFSGFSAGMSTGVTKQPKSTGLLKPASIGASLGKPIPNKGLNSGLSAGAQSTPTAIGGGLFSGLSSGAQQTPILGSGSFKGIEGGAQSSQSFQSQPQVPQYNNNNSSFSIPSPSAPPKQNNFNYSDSSPSFSPDESSFMGDMSLPDTSSIAPPSNFSAPTSSSNGGISLSGSSSGGGSSVFSSQLAALREKLNKSKSEYDLFSEQTDEEKQIQSQLDNLNTTNKNLEVSRDLGLNEIQNQTIPLQFITGQKAALERSAAAKAQGLAAQAEPLTQKLARLQADRQMRQQSKKNELADYQGEIQNVMEQQKSLMPQLKEVGGNLIEYDPSTGGYRTVFSPQQNESYKPIEVGSGGTLVDPKTGKVIYSSTASQNIKPTDDIQEFNLAKGQGFKGSFVDFKRELANLKEIGSAASNLPASYKEYQLTQSNPGYGQYLNKNTMGGNESSLNEKQMKQIESSTEAKKLLSLKDLQGKLQAYRDAAGQPGGFESFGPRKALLDSLYADLKISYKEAAGLGALTGPDVAIITEAIKPISGVTNYPSYLASGRQKGVISSIDQALSSAKRQGQLNYDSLLSKYKGLENDPYIQNLGQGLVATQSNNQNVSGGYSQKIQQARSNGYNSQQIVDYLKKDPSLSSKIIQAQQNGYNQDDIIRYVSSFNQPLSTGINGSLSGLAGAKLGQLSEKYESGGNPGAIGYDNIGGWSYGKYQLAHNNAQRFVDQSPFKQAFQGLTFNSPQWRSRWQEVAKKYPNEFAEAQDSYITQNWYTPLASKAMQNGLNLGNYSPVLKDVVFSTAVQHGAGTDVVEKALARVGNNPSEADIIKAIYNERWSGGRRFANSTPNVKQSVYNRFFGKNGELNTALSQLS